MRTSDLPSSAESQNVGWDSFIGSSSRVVIVKALPRQESINSWSVDSFRTVAAMIAFDVDGRRSTRSVETRGGTKSGS